MLFQTFVCLMPSINPTLVFRSGTYRAEVFTIKARTAEPMLSPPYGKRRDDMNTDIDGNDCIVVDTKGGEVDKRGLVIQLLTCHKTGLKAYILCQGMALL
jgi:hypothetical protein